MNLLNTIMGQLGSGTIDKLSGALGENAADTKSALGAAIPALMGQVANKAQTKEGAGQLMDMIGNNDGSKDFSSMLSNKDSLLSSGNSMVSGLLGNSAGGFSSMLSKFTGMRGGSMTSLLGMVAPLIMGTLGKAKSTMGLNASGMSNLLAEQSDSFTQAMPSGLADKMGSFGLGNLTGGVKNVAGNVAGGVKNVGGSVVEGTGNLAGKAAGGVKAGAGAVGGAVSGAGRGAANVAGDVGRGAANVAGDVTEAGGGLMRKLGPLLGFLLLALLGILGWRACGGDVNNAADKAINATENVATKAADATKNAAGKAVDATKSAAGTVGDAAGKAADATKNAAGKAVDATKDAAGAVGSAVKKGASALGLAANSAEAGLADMLSSGKAKVGSAIALEGVKFATGSANLEASSFKQLDNIKKIMDSYPNLNIKLEGHTDNTGDATKNRTLSEARAKAVMNYLVSKGIKKSSLSAQGFGDAKPVASNKDADGRRQNRRVEASISSL